MSTDTNDTTSAAIAALAEQIAARALPIMDHLGIPKDDHADVLLAAAEMHAASGDDQSPLDDAVALAALLQEAWEAIGGSNDDDAVLSGDSGDGGDGDGTD